MATTDRLNEGDIVLVTGVTGFLGASTADFLASKGLKVRGVTRDVVKGQGLVDKITQLYGPGLIELVQVVNHTAEGAYTEALQGAAGVIHLALDPSNAFGPDANVDLSVQAAIDMTVGILKSAHETPSVRSVVVTSSVVANYIPAFGEDASHSVKDYNEKSVKAAYSGDWREVYAASKTRAEQELWKWVDDAKPSFAINTVLPHLVLGEPFNPYKTLYSTSGWLSELFNGNTQGILYAFVVEHPPHWIVDVSDTAIITVAALLASDITGRRLWAAGHEIESVNDILAIWRKTYPDRKLPADYDVPKNVQQTLDRTTETELIKRYAGRDYTPLEQTLLDNIKRDL